MKDSIVQIDVDDFAAACSTATLTPTSSVVPFNGLKPTSVYNGQSPLVWALALGFAQDWENTQSLANYLLDHAGETKTAIIKPRTGSGPSFTVTIVITPGAIGGAVGAVPQSTVTLGVSGQPVKTPAAATVPNVTGSDKVSGTTAGGTLVEVVGSKFLGTTAVYFGAVAATQFTVESDTNLFVISPAAAAGSKPIKVTNAVGQSVSSAPYSFV
jgi:hypothetical protein